MKAGALRKFDRSGKVVLISLLSAPNIGNRRAIELVELFETPDSILTAPAGEIAEALKVRLDTGKDVVKALRNLGKAESILSRTETIGARYVTYWDDEFPTRLRKISDPPAAIYISGEQSPLYDYAIAIVGTRASSSHAQKVALNISREISASGVTVVSGMALGIDTKAHEGAILSGGRTAAVLGCGVDVVYPPSNRRLYEKILKQGVVISEYPPGTSPDQHHFPQRNRIISGLSIGVVVVEAGMKSGALITAKIALDQGRELFAVPGAAGLPRTAGVNGLLKDGAAHFVETGAEIIELLRSQLAPVLNVSATLALPEMNATESLLYTCLENGPKLIDEIIREVGKNALETNRLLTSMQLKGLIRQIPGARIERA